MRGLGDPGFLSYLGTLGLSSFSGQEKEGLAALLEEAAARGFGGG